MRYQDGTTHTDGRADRGVTGVMSAGVDAFQGHHHGGNRGSRPSHGEVRPPRR